ncbi:MAG: penicillin-binding transpeptidase domain-containing protein [Bacillota bacterium]|jgi:cell division protein FtsI/penicillin-binding protein 2
MKKITFRTFICLLIAFILVGGTGFFLFKYVTAGNEWISFAANRHLYTDGMLNKGQVLDKNGEVLVNTNGGDWIYNDSSSVRKATLHAAGDPAGMIGTGAVSVFANKITGYNFLTGAKTSFSGGRNLYLTVDAGICAAAYEAMGNLNGTVGVYNYKTGEIVCMVSAPSYDPKNPPEITDDNEYKGAYINNLISANFIPGSTFKLVTTAAALDNISDVQSRTFKCTGSVQIGDDVVTCTSAHGTLDLGEALTVSCNCTFGQLAAELGQGVMEEYVSKVGLTNSYSVNGIATVPSTFDFATDKNKLAWSGVGQGNDMVNPCSLMVYAGAIANGGKAAVPQIISKVKTSGGIRTSIYLKHSTDQLLEESTANTLRDMMKANVANNYGSGNFPNLDAGAKSGTAQSDHAEENNAWFVGFCDSEEYPYAFVVYLEGGNSGSKTAGRVASQVMQAVVNSES